MAIAEDTTNSPALVVSSGATTDTAAFTPPNAGCILVCFMFGDANAGANDETLTASDSLAGTWSTPVLDNARGGAAAAISWRAVAAGTAASMTVSVTDNKGSVAKGNFTRIFTGTSLTAPFGATGTAGTAAISLVSTVTNSWCWSALLTSNALQSAGTATTQKTEFGGFDGGDAIGVYASTNTTATAGTTITITETGAVPVHHVAVELVPPGGATVNAAVTPAAGASMTVGATQTGFPAATFGAGAVLAVAAVKTAVSTVTMASGATMAIAGTKVAVSAVAFGSNAVMTSAAFDTVLPGAGFAAGAVLAAAGSRTAVVAAAFSAGARFSITAASAGPLVASVLVPGGSNPSTLVPSGTAVATLIAAGASTATLVAGGV